MKTLTVLHRSAAAVVIMALAVFAPIAHGEMAEVSSLRLEKSADASRYVIDQTGSAAYQEFLLNNPKRLVLDIVGARHGLGAYTHDGDGRLVQRVRSSQFTNDPDEVTRIVFDLSEDAKYKVSRIGNQVEVSFFSDGSPKPAVPTMGADMGAASWDTDVKPMAPKTADSAKAEKAEKAAPKPMADQKAATESSDDDATVVPMPVEKSEKSDADTSADASAKPAPAWTAPNPASTQKDTPAKEWTAPEVSSQPASSWSAPQPAATQSQPQQVAATNPWAGSNTDGGVRASSQSSELSSFLATGQSQMAESRITMDVQGADIKTVLRSVSEFSGQNIIAGPDVEGPVTVHLKEVPWREALDMILKSNGYGVREEYGIIRVGTLDRLHDEELGIATAAQKKEELLPMVTRVVELNFTNAKEMQQAMDKVTTKRGNISVEKGTNSVIIQDIPDNADQIAEMVRGLDKKVQQVEIVAKMVDVDVEATREIGVNWDFSNVFVSDFNAAASAFSGQQLANPFSGLRVGSVQSWGSIDLLIEALARDNKADIISNPKITTADNSEASILVGKEIPLIVSDEAGNPITELKKVGVTLRVTPHVNSDGTITMDLHPELSDLSSQATVQGGIVITLQEANTRVLVRDGETAVIGGLMQDIKTVTETGVPGLKDVPLLGALFRYKAESTRKRELVIFVTPRIVEFDGQS